MTELKLTTQEIAYILNVLALRPYGEVTELIAKIQKQAVDDQPSAE